MATQKETLYKWLSVTITALQESIAKHNIGVTGELAGSIGGKVNADSGGNVSNIDVFYRFYGQFVDMGVRRGVPIEEALKTNAGKRWYSPTIQRRVNALSELMMNVYGSQAMSTISEGMPGNVRFKM